MEGAALRDDELRNRYKARRSRVSPPAHARATRTIGCRGVAAPSARRLLAIALAVAALGGASLAAAAEEWGPIGEETAALLAEVIRIDTSNPPGNETTAAEAFERKLRAEGIPTD